MKSYPSDERSSINRFIGEFSGALGGLLEDVWLTIEDNELSQEAEAVRGRLLNSSGPLDDAVVEFVIVEIEEENESEAGLLLCGGEDEGELLHE